MCIPKWNDPFCLCSPATQHHHPLTGTLSRLTEGIEAELSTCPCVGLQSIAIRLSYVCLSWSISETDVQASPNFRCMLPMVIAWSLSSAVRVAIRYVLPVLCMTLWLHIMVVSATCVIYRTSRLCYEHDIRPSVGNVGGLWSHIVQKVESGTWQDRSVSCHRNCKFSTCLMSVMTTYHNTVTTSFQT